MSVKSLTRVYCDKCNPKQRDSDTALDYRGVLTVTGEFFALRMKAIFDDGWQRRGNEHWCPICVKEEKEEADAQNKWFRQSRTGRR